MEFVGSVTLKSDLRKSVIAYFDSFLSIMWPGIMVSIVMALIFVLSAVRILLEEREGEFATLRAFGFGRWEVTRLILSEVMLLGVTAVLLAGPLWVGLSWLIGYQTSKAWFEIALDLRLQDVAMVGVPMLLGLPFAAVPGIRSMLDLDLSETLRRRLTG
jgi:putative ABC transport system permease protein